jgi:hypothetical protein
VVIPKSVTPSRIAENFDVWDFRLDKDELGEIAKLDKGKRLGPDPDQFGGNRVKAGWRLRLTRPTCRHKNPGLPGFFIYALRFTGFFTLELPFER